MRERLFTMSRIFFKLFLVLLDVFCLTGFYALSLRVRFSENFASYFDPYVFFVLLPTTILTMVVIGGYNRSNDMSSLRFVSEHVIASVVNFFLVLFLIYFLTGVIAARANVALVLIVFPLWSLTVRYMLAALTRKTQVKRSLYIVGAGEQAVDFFHVLKSNNWPQNLVFFDPTQEKDGANLIPGDPSSPIIQGDLIDALETRGQEVDSIVIAEKAEDLPQSLLEKLVSIHFMKAQVQTLYTFFATHWKMVPVSQVSPYWAFEEGFRLNSSLTYERAKRIFDIIFALVGFLLLWPILVIVAMAVRLSSAGPVVFKQVRVGRDEKPFTLYKFRTMVVGSEEKDLYTRPEDKRITRVGSLLRITRLDELLQLWNVLRGEMSVIGPRAEWKKIVDIYENKIPFYHFRHLVKPGITGWAQVNYPYGENDRDAVEKLKYDLYYVRHYSLLLDLSICLKTIHVVLFGQGR